MQIPNNESLGDMINSQMSGQDGNVAEIKTVKDARAMIAEKNIPRTIKNLNRIFYSFIILLFAVSGVLIYFFAVNKQIMNQANLSIKVSNSRHSLLAEINYFVRKLHLIGTEVLSSKSEEQATKDTVDLINLVQRQEQPAAAGSVSSRRGDSPDEHAAEQRCVDQEHHQLRANQYH